MTFDPQADDATQETLNLLDDQLEAAKEALQTGQISQQDYDEFFDQCVSYSSALLED